MIGSYACGLNSELFLHTDKTIFFLSVHVYLFLHRFRNELARSLTFGNNFSSIFTIQFIK